MSVEINGRNYSAEKAKKLLNNPDIIVTEAKFYIPSKHKSRELSNDGFDIPKEMIVQMSSNMDLFNAGVMCASFENCKTINNKSLFIFMVSPGRNSKWKMFIWNILRKML